jgi:hypothetical protein
MGLYQLWSGKDIYNTILSLQTTMMETTVANSTRPSRSVGEYQQGYIAALRAVALSFGLRPPALPRPLAEAMERNLLEG